MPTGEILLKLFCQAGQREKSWNGHRFLPLACLTAQFIKAILSGMPTGEIFGYGI
jgi:hypothetical protein